MDPKRMPRCSMDVRHEMVVLLMLLALALPSAQGVLTISRSSSENATKARDFLSLNDWGVVSTISVHLNGTPWGNIASFSDGPANTSCGTPYFYLSKWDATPVDFSADPRCSLSLSGMMQNTCVGIDPENPNCTRLTLSGQMKEVTDNVTHAFAWEALLYKHPDMAGWPISHKFTIYELDISNIFLLYKIGGQVPVTVAEYYDAYPELKDKCPPLSSHSIHGNLMFA